MCIVNKDFYHYITGIINIIELQLMNVTLVAPLISYIGRQQNIYTQQILLFNLQVEVLIVVGVVIIILCATSLLYFNDNIFRQVLLYSQFERVILQLLLQEQKITSSCMIINETKKKAHVVWSIMLLYRVFGLKVLENKIRTHFVSICFYTSSFE